MRRSSLNSTTVKSPWLFLIPFANLNHAWALPSRKGKTETVELKLLIVATHTHLKKVDHGQTLSFKTSDTHV